MGGLALVKSGDEVLRRLSIENSFDFSIDWLLRLMFKLNLVKISEN